MADPAIKIGAEVFLANTSKLEKSIAQLERRTRLKFSVDDRASLPLGRIAKNAADIDKSLDAATARVVSFGIAAGAVNAVANTFSQLATSIIEVEDALAKINVNFGATQDQLRTFTKEVFNAATNTGKTFNEAAKAAEELARQGLGVEETTKRLNNALILSRRAGIDSAEAVDTLTAAFNSYSSAGLDTTQIINKLVAVDTRFAVSTKDLSDAISRSASTAQEAGLTFDEFLGIVTSVQQTTARGGAVIGNALKTIFTRVQAAPETIKALEKLGVAITDSSGAFTTAGDRLRQYAAIRQNLSEGDRVYYDRIISGTQQINILTAALNDLGKANSVAAQAQKVSLNATNEAIVQNEELNKTLKAIINESGQGIVQLFSNIGKEAGENFKSTFNIFNDLLSLINNSEGAIKGLGNLLSGPVLVGGLLLIGKALGAVAKDLGQTLSSISGLNSASKARLEVERQIAAVTANATSEELKRLNSATSLAERRTAYLAIEQRITAELARQSALSGSLASSLTPRVPFDRGFGLVSGLVGKRRENPLSSATTVPNYADPLQAAISREIAAGVNPRDIYIDQDPRVKGPGNPMGLLVANKRDEPMGGAQGVARAIREGANPKNYGARGTVPNFAEFDSLISKTPSKLVGRKVKDVLGNVTTFGETQDIGGGEASKQLRSLFRALRQEGSKSVDAFKQNTQSILDLVKQYNITGDSLKDIQSKIGTSAQKLQQNLSVQAALRKAEEDRAKVLEAENKIRARDFERAKKQLPKENFPEIPLEKGLTPAQIKKQKEALFRQLEAEANAAVGPGATSSGKPLSNILPPTPATRLLAIRGRQFESLARQFKQGILPVSGPGSVIRNPTKSAAGIESTQLSPKERSELASETAFAENQRRNEAKRNLEIERNLIIRQQRVDAAISTVSKGGVPSGGEVGTFRAEASALARQRILQDENVKRLLAGKSIARASKEVQELVKFKIKNELDAITSGFEKALESNIRNQRGLRDQERISRVFDRFGSDFFGSRNQRVREGLLRRVSPENRQLVEEAFRNREEGRLQRRQQIAFAGAFAAPLLAGFVPEGQGGTVSGIGLGAASGALQFAGVGALAGPVGAGVGAVIGGLIGAFSKLEKSSKELAKSFEKENSFRQESLSSLKTFTSLQEELQSAIKSGDTNTVDRLNKQVADVSRQVEPEILKRFRNSGDLESLRQSEEQRQRELDARLAQQQAQLLFKEGFFGSSLSNERALDVSNLARVFNVIGGERVSEAAGTFNQRRLSEIERFGAATPGSSRNADVTRTIKFISDELTKLPENLRPSVKVTGNNISELARFLRELAKASKQVSESTKEEIKEAEKRSTLAAANRIRGTFVGFGAEESGIFSSFGRGTRGSIPKFSQNDLLASVLEIIEKQSKNLPKELEPIQNRVEGERGFRGSIEALNSLVSGLTNLNFKLPSGEFDIEGLLRTSSQLQNRRDINPDARQVLASLSETANTKRAGGFGPQPERFSVFAPGESVVNPGNILRLGGGLLGISSEFNPENTIFWGGDELPPSRNRLSFGSKISVGGSLLPISTESEEETRKRRGILAPAQPVSEPPLSKIDPNLEKAEQLSREIAKNIKDLNLIQEEIQGVARTVVEAVKQGLDIKIVLETFNNVILDEAVSGQIEDVDALKQKVESALKRLGETEKKAGIVRPPVTNSRGRAK